MTTLDGLAVLLIANLVIMTVIAVAWWQHYYMRTWQCIQHTERLLMELQNQMLDQAIISNELKQGVGNQEAIFKSKATPSLCGRQHLPK